MCEKSAMSAESLNRFIAFVLIDWLRAHGSVGLVRELEHQSIVIQDIDHSRA